MATKRKGKQPPIKARTIRECNDLPETCIDLGKDVWFLLDQDAATVTLCDQKPGEEPTGKVTMSRRLFDELVRWYTTGSKR